MVNTTKHTNFIKCSILGKYRGKLHNSFAQLEIHSDVQYNLISGTWGWRNTTNYWICCTKVRYSCWNMIRCAVCENFASTRWTVWFLQHISGADLGILLVDVLVKSENRKYAEWTPKLCKIFAKINSTVPERDVFVLHMIRWSSGDRKHGFPLLHQVRKMFWNY